MSDIRIEYARLGEVLREKKLFAGEVNIAIAKNNMSLETQIKHFEKGVKDLAERFVAKDVNGNPVIKNNKYTFETMEDENCYLKGVEELENTELELEIQMVKYDVLNDGKHDEPTACDLVALNFMLED